MGGHRSVSPVTNFGIALLRARREAFARRLDVMAAAERWQLVEEARQEERWPNAAWVKSHRAEKMPDLTAAQYKTLAQSVKRRPGTQVYALIHIIHGNEGLAFIDPERRVLVWFNLDEARNFSCFYLEESVDAFLEQKGDFYWRLPDTELE
jgi:hypothetical protein